MPLSKLKLTAGINRDETSLAAKGSYYDGQLIRFRNGYPEKFGGWTVANTISPYQGTARTLYTYTTSDGNLLATIGTQSKIYVFAGTTLYDITPIRATFTHSTSPSTDNIFTITANSNVVTVTMLGNGAINGDYVKFSGVTGTVGGVNLATYLNGISFLISNVNASTGTFTITMTPPTAPTAGATNVGGTAITAVFQINSGNSLVTQGYGWGTSTWGRSTWGSGSTTAVYDPARFVFMQNFGNDLIFNTTWDPVAQTGGIIYYWTYNNSFSNVGVPLNTTSGAVAVPQEVTKILFSSTTGFLIAFGCTAYNAAGTGPDYLGTYNPLLIRWSNVDPVYGPQPGVWQPTATNLSGDLQVQAGSKIITAINTKQEILVFTNISLNSMQFLGNQLVFGISELSHNISIMGPNAVVGINNIVYWMGRDRFYMYNGVVNTLPCTIRKYIFDTNVSTSVNYNQSSIIFAGVNNKFNEIIWFYSSQASTSQEIDTYVVYNFQDQIWYYGNLSRTAWVDAGDYPVPLGLSSGYINQHEVGTDNGQPANLPPLPINSYITTGDIDIQDGDRFALLRRVVPDIDFTNSDNSIDNGDGTNTPVTPEVTLTVGVRNFPGDAINNTNSEGQTTTANILTSASATINPYTEQVFIRARGRQMIFTLGSNTLGTQWQMGDMRIDTRTDGTRA